MSREVMQMALEALEQSKTTVPYEGFGMAQREAERKHQAAIAALRAALAEPQEPVAVVELMKTGGNAGLATRIVEIDDHLRERLRPGTKLYLHPAPQRQKQDEPVAGVVLNEEGRPALVEHGQEDWHCANRKARRLYTHPAPQRPPLTVEEIWSTYKRLWPFHPAEEPRMAGDVLIFARAIEAAHGITGEQK